jgi:P-type E1-E2 ATPase
MAGELGIDRVFAEKAPEEKADVISGLRAANHKVAYLGDGVNDGPALMAADVGIAMNNGAELAKATADVVLLEDRLDLLLTAFALSQNTMQLIRSNYNLTVGINTGVLLGAAAGWLPPIATTLLHNGTTIGVLLRALRGARAGEST